MARGVSGPAAPSESAMMHARDLILPTSPGKLARLWAGCPAPWGAKVSPDGRWVAWAWVGLDVAADIYVAPTDCSAPPRRLTAPPPHSLSPPWAPRTRESGSAPC